VRGRLFVYVGFRRGAGNGVVDKPVAVHSSGPSGAGTITMTESEQSRHKMNDPLPTGETLPTGTVTFMSTDIVWRGL
jgi:hypothetical protein